MNRALLIRYTIKKYLLFYIPYLAIVLFLSIAFNMLIVRFENEWIPYNFVYCEQGDMCRQYAVENKINYYLSPSILNANAITSSEIINKQKLADLRYTNEATPTLIERNMDLMNNQNKEWIESYVRFNYYPQVINELKIPNCGLDIEAILIGTYPNNVTELLIPEYFAQVLINEGAGEDYESLIGSEIKFDFKGEKNKQYQYIISGIYSGGYDFIINPPSNVVSESNLQLTSTFVEFDNINERRLFFSQINKQDVIDTSDASLIVISYYYIYPIIKLIIVICGIYFSYQVLKKDISTLNFYKIKATNTILPLVLPIILILITVYLI